MNNKINILFGIFILYIFPLLSILILYNYRKYYNKYLYILLLIINIIYILFTIIYTLIIIKIKYDKIFNNKYKLKN